MSKNNPVWDASNLRARIAAANLRMTDLAVELGISPGTLTNWTQGRTEPGVTALTRIAELAECRVVDLLPPVKGVDDE